MTLTPSRLMARAALAGAFLLAASPAWAQATAPTLGTTSTYGVVSSTYTNSNTAPGTVITGTAGQPALCYTTPPATFPLTVVGTTVTPCPPQTGSDQTTALATLNGQSCTSLGGGAITLDSVVIGANPPGTIPPGCYSSGGAMNITANTTVTLKGNGVYVFRPGGAVTTGAASQIAMSSGACESDVYWAPVAAVTVGGGAATFVGSILDAAGITLGHFATLTGRALAFGGTVTTDANSITVPTCAAFSGGGGGVIVNPTITKSFSPTTIGVAGISTMTITLANNNATSATLTAPLTDTLPSGVVLAPSPTAATTCGGTVTAAAGASSVTLSQAGSAIPASGSCTVTANVTAPAAGVYTNTIPINALQTSNGNNLAAVSAVLTVSAAIVINPTITKSFSPTSIGVAAVSTLTITLANNNATAATLSAALVDTLPSGVVLAPSPTAATTCGGTVTAAAGASSVTLSQAGSAIPALGNCTVTANVTAAAAGVYTNTIPINALQTSNGNNLVAASAVLTVSAAIVINPTITKAFNPSSNGVAGVSTLTITLANNNATAATLTAAFVDTLPSGVVLAPTPSAGTTCAGTVTAAAGASAITLSQAGSVIPALGSCTVTANVTAAAAGVYTNTIPINALQTSNGNNLAAASAVLTISAAVLPVPALPVLALLVLAALLGLAGYFALGRRRAAG